MTDMSDEAQIERDQTDRAIHALLTAGSGRRVIGSLDGRVLQRIRAGRQRRRIAGSLALAASLVAVLLFWKPWQPQEPERVADRNERVEVASEGDELLASVLTVSPPVVDMGPVADESNALLGYLDAMESRQESK